MNSTNKVLIACEESQTITIEFRKQGIEAYSCDLELCSGGHPEWHLQQDVLPLLQDKWSMIIAHPPCTYLSNAGMGWFNIDRYGDKARERRRLRLLAFDFFMKFTTANSKHICIENPVGWVNSHWRKPDQIIQPWQFGHPESKTTCLWLKNLPKLEATNILTLPDSGRWDNQTPSGQNKLGPSKNRAKIRSKTYLGIAKAIVKQWSVEL